jgi:hypothetical protein
MSSATFLSNEQLWQTLRAKVKSARHVAAAIAYVGQSGAKLLPLRRGDRLVVDMTWIRRILAFQEAAESPVDDRLCTEPIRPKYIEVCKRLYRPPHFAGKDAAEKRQARVNHAKLWIVALRDGFSLPESELSRFKRGEAKAKELLSDDSSSKTESFFWPFKPRMANELEPGDSIIQVVKYGDDTVLVKPPGRLLSIDNYIRNHQSGKERYVFHLELPRRGETLTWSEFQRAARALLKSATLSRRSRPVRNPDSADALLRLWTPAGRISRR